MADRTYKGWTVELGYDNRWMATGPNYDASYEGPEDGWVSNGECVQGCNTLEELHDEIDAYLEEHAGEAK